MAGAITHKVLQRYVFHLRPEPLRRDEDNLFLTLEGKPLSGNTVRLIFSQLAQRSGVNHLKAHFMYMKWYLKIERLVLG